MKSQTDLPTFPSHITWLGLCLSAPLALPIWARVAESPSLLALIGTDTPAAPSNATVLPTVVVSGRPPLLRHPEQTSHSEGGTARRVPRAGQSVSEDHKK
jgi:hypothetical protein